MKTRLSYLLPVLMIVLIVSFAWADAKHEAEDHHETDSKHGAEDVHETEELQEFIRDASLENGRKLYTTGYNLKNQAVPIEGGPHWLSMHGGSCTGCHGVKGEGGITPMMCNIKTPPITFQALAGDEHGSAEESHEETGEEHAHEPYTLESLRTALENGVNSGGEKFDPCMPRWKFSDDDYRDLAAYLIHLGESEAEDEHAQ
jgi:mono/diheme cytochrome c family protein